MQKRLLVFFYSYTCNFHILNLVSANGYDSNVFFFPFPFATEDVSHLLKYYRRATIKGIGHVGMIGLLITSVSLPLICNTAANIFSNYQPRCPTNHRGSHSKLRLMLLFTVSWCSFISLHVTVQQSGCTFKVHHTVFGISFVLSISCVLGKSILVLRAFRATLPGSVVKWPGLQYRDSVFLLTHLCDINGTVRQFWGITVYV